MLNYILSCYTYKNVIKTNQNYISIINIPFSPAEATYIPSLLRDVINVGRHFADIIKVPSIPSYTGKMRIDVPVDTSHKINTLSLPELCIHIILHLHFTVCFYIS